MGIFSRFVGVSVAALAAVTLATPVPAGPATASDQPTVAQPGGVSDIILTAQNTLNATNGSPPPHFQQLSAMNLPLALVNEIRAGPVTAYITGLDTSNRLVFVQSNGQFYYPTAQQGNTTPQQVPDANIGIPLGAYGTTQTVNLANYLSSGRIYFGVGKLSFYTVYPSGASGPTLVQPAANNPKDPNALVKWGFIEFTTNSASGIYVNLSNVDFVGLVLGMALQTGSGTTLNARGLKPGSLQPMCDAMKQAGQDGQPWPKLCMVDNSNNALRVLGPQDYLSIPGSTKFSAYWENYVNQVFTKYTTQTLTVVTPTHGNVPCKVVNGAITCQGDNHSYAKPIAIDIYGCNSGPFQVYPDANDVHKEVYPRICAAFNRATLLLQGGETQPSLPATSYYQSEPSNLYSKNVHQLSVDGTGYAFPYDDVNPNGSVDQAGALTDSNPQKLTVYIGGQQ
ncbi:glycoside hydrolase family 64 protein [Dothistroma septosporum NZE10]|uniref:Glycoside hydrolase family 64 protein n=1 Tax=Dothistroma septosporum (strain NZE10 / CBS 128990) TaxID=675120 RepID=N1PTG4_DOTSN|nr:glycoside hydrolase family 64 protein [Dothistroma septosporum NZE10]